MADPRFFENLGPFTLAQICEKAGIAVPADGGREFFDLADLAGSDSRHLTFFSGNFAQREAFAASRAGACLVPAPSSGKGGKRPDAPAGMIVLECVSVSQAFAAAAALFYPEHSQARWPGDAPAISPLARIGQGVTLAPGVTIGAGAEIGDGTRIGDRKSVV